MLALEITKKKKNSSSSSSSSSSNNNNNNNNINNNNKSNSRISNCRGSSISRKIYGDGKREGERRNPFQRFFFLLTCTVGEIVFCVPDVCASCVARGEVCDAVGAAHGLDVVDVALAAEVARSGQVDLEGLTLVAVGGENKK